MKLSDIKSFELLPRFAKNKNTQSVCSVFDDYIKDVNDRLDTLPLQNPESLSKMRDDELYSMAQDLGVLPYFPDLDRDIREGLITNCLNYTSKGISSVAITSVLDAYYDTDTASIDDSLANNYIHHFKVYVEGTQIADPTDFRRFSKILKDYTRASKTPSSIEQIGNGETEYSVQICDGIDGLYRVEGDIITDVYVPPENFVVRTDLVGATLTSPIVPPTGIPEGTYNFVLEVETGYEFNTDPIVNNTRMPRRGDGNYELSYHVNSDVSVYGHADLIKYQCTLNLVNAKLTSPSIPEDGNLEYGHYSFVVEAEDGYTFEGGTAPSLNGVSFTKISDTKYERTILINSSFSIDGECVLVNQKGTVVNEVEGGFVTPEGEVDPGTYNIHVKSSTETTFIGGELPTIDGNPMNVITEGLDYSYRTKIEAGDVFVARGRAIKRRFAVINNIAHTSVRSSGIKDDGNIEAGTQLLTIVADDGYTFDGGTVPTVDGGATVKISNSRYQKQIYVRGDITIDGEVVEFTQEYPVTNSLINSKLTSPTIQDGKLVYGKYQFIVESDNGYTFNGGTAPKINGTDMEMVRENVYVKEILVEEPIEITGESVPKIYRFRKDAINADIVSPNEVTGGIRGGTADIFAECDSGYRFDSIPTVNGSEMSEVDTKTYVMDSYLVKSDITVIAHAIPWDDENVLPAKPTA